MKTLAVIPARLGAARLPRKPLRLLAGAPLIIRVWERVSAFAAVDRCVVATDDEEVARVAREAGAEYVLTSATHPSGTDRVAEVVRSGRFDDYGAIVNVQGDEPFVSEAAVGAAVALVTRGGFALGTVAVATGTDALSRPEVVKVVRDDAGRALYFSRAPIPFLRDGEDRAVRDALVYRHLGVYSYTPQALAAWVSLPVHPLERVERLEQLRPLAAGMAIGVALVEEAGGGGIDTEDDLTRANARWNDHLAGRH